MIPFARALGGESPAAPPWKAGPQGEAVGCRVRDGRGAVVRADPPFSPAFSSRVRLPRLRPYGALPGFLLGVSCLSGPGESPLVAGLRWPGRANGPTEPGSGLGGLPSACAPLGALGVSLLGMPGRGVAGCAQERLEREGFERGRVEGEGGEGSIGCPRTSSSVIAPDGIGRAIRYPWTSCTPSEASSAHWS